MTDSVAIKIPDKHLSEANQARANLLDKRTPATKAQHDACLLRLKEREAAKMAAVDVDALLVSLAGGMTQAECAEQYGVAASTLSVWLNSQSGEMAKRIAAARRASADAFADRALEALTKREGSESGPDVALGTAIAKHMMQRAAFADRARYHDKGAIEQAQPQGQQIPAFTIQILNTPNNQTLTITPSDNGENLI